MKQRWRKTKKPMKWYRCDSCWERIRVLKDYEPTYCCDGFECGCFGHPIDPMYCDDCERIILGKRVRK